MTASSSMLLFREYPLSSCGHIERQFHKKHNTLAFNQRAMRKSVHLLPRLPARHAHGRCVWPGRSLQTELDTAGAPVKADAVLAAASAAVLQAWPSANTVLRYTGEAKHMGIAMRWSLLLRPDGAFREELQSKNLSSVSGHDGGENSSCWEVDGMGVPKELELDDHEHCLMINWVRTGFWLRPEARERLHLGTGEEYSAGEQLHADRSPDMQHDPIAPASTSNGVSADAQHTARISVQLCRGQVMGQLEACAGSWQPACLSVRLFGHVDKHHFSQWKMENKHWFPRHYLHTTSAGSQNVYTVHNSSVSDVSVQHAFSIPQSWLRPPDTSFDPPQGPGLLKAWWTQSGHILVAPRIDGQEVGYMILDTGATGFVIEKAVADQLGLEAFGRDHATGMMGNVEIRLRRCAQIQLGPLAVKSALFMEMSLADLVQGAPGQVVGIIGYDIFRRCVMDIPFTQDKKGAFDIQIYDPSLYKAPAELDPFWHSLEFIASLPLIKTTIGVNGASFDVRLMIDSGAGGIDLMFNARATEELNLLDSIPVSTRLVKGVGGSSAERQRVKSGVLPWMKISQSHFEKLNCLFIGKAGLDLSTYVKGIICADLVARCRIVLDFARRRIALIPAAQLQEAESNLLN